MFKISLINMPFAGLQQPSLALTQLRTVVSNEFKDRVSVDLLYLDHDFARFFGFQLTELITDSAEAQNSAIGEWLFRQIAFPELEDNSVSYFKRFFPVMNDRLEAVKRMLLDKRGQLNQFMDKLIDEYKLDEADIVGFTSMFSQNVASLAMARKLKERNPKIITVIGGANCESPMGQEIALHVKQIDFVFSGPGLKSFTEFVRNCLNQDMDRCHTLPGVFSRTNCRFNVLSTKASLGEEIDLDTLIELDYDSFLESYEKTYAGTKFKPVILFETSRGCWWGERAHCTFCGLNGATMNYRSMKPENALKQFDNIFKYSAYVDRFQSVDNILPKSYFHEVLPHLKTPENVEIFYEVKADLSEEDMQVLSNARVKFVQPGIEALATPVLKLMKKGTSSIQNLFLLKNCVLYDISPEWNLLVGFPGEQEDVYGKYLEDIPLLTHLPPPGGVFPVRFDRYSPYFVKAAEYGLDLEPLDYYEFIYPFSRESLKKLAYYFTDRNFGADYNRFVSKWIAKLRTTVNHWQTRWRDHKVPPRLCFKGDEQSTIIYDSRSGNIVEHEVGKHGRQILEYLNKPRRLADITNELSNFPGVDPASEIAKLQNKGLIFNEGDRYFNLVLPAETLK